MSPVRIPRNPDDGHAQPTPRPPTDRKMSNRAKVVWVVLWVTWLLATIGAWVHAAGRPPGDSVWTAAVAIISFGGGMLMVLGVMTDGQTGE